MLKTSFCVEFLKPLPVNQYSVDMFSYSGPSGIFGSDRKQDTAKASDRGMRIVALYISSHAIFLILLVLSIYEGSVFPDYFECVFFNWLLH